MGILDNVKYFTINIFFFHCQILSPLLFHFLSSSWRYSCSTSSLLLIQEWQWGKAPCTNTHMHFYFHMVTSVLATGSKFLSITAKIIIGIGEVVCFKRRKQVLEMCAFCRRIYSQSMLQGLFSDLTGKGYWCWDCLIPWEPLHLKGHHGLLANSLAKT